MSTTSHDLSAELVPNEPALTAVDWAEYAALLTEIDDVEITDETGH